MIRSHRVAADRLSLCAMSLGLVAAVPHAICLADDEVIVSGWAAVGHLNDADDPPLIETMAVYDSGFGSHLYVGGSFDKIGGVAANNIARWDGRVWQAVGGGTDDWVRCMTVADLGDGPKLYIGGTFKTFSGIEVNHIAVWDGRSVKGLDGGLSNLRGFRVGALTIATFDDGAGKRLYVGGDFRKAGDTTVSLIAAWDGASWHALPGVVENGRLEPAIGALHVHDDGSAPQLFVGGSFTKIDGVASECVIAFDGQSWRALGNGVKQTVFLPACTVLLTDPFEAEAPLLAIGSFADRVVIQAWDGTAWTSHTTAEPISGANTPSVRHAAIVDDGLGDALFLTGIFSTVQRFGQESLEVSSIARWSGHTYTAMGAGLSGVTQGRLGRALLEMSLRGRPHLLVGGYFAQAGGLDIPSLTAWGPLHLGDTNCDGRLDFGDIDAFTLAITDPAGYAFTYPSCDRNHADCNGDNEITFDDIDSFVSYLAKN